MRNVIGTEGLVFAADVIVGAVPGSEGSGRSWNGLSDTSSANNAFVSGVDGGIQMNPLRRVICCALVFSGVAFGQGLATGQSDSMQGRPAQAPQSDQRLNLAPGSVIPAELVKTVDAKKSSTGDEVQAKVTQDLKADNGQVLVPKDTKIVGRLMEVQARSKTEPTISSRACLRSRGAEGWTQRVTANVDPGDHCSGSLTW